MSFGANNSGSIRSTIDVNVGGGAPTRVFAVHEIYSENSTGSVFRNGTSASDDMYISLNSTDSSGVTTTFGADGLLFPDGLFLDIGTAVVSSFIEFRREN